jgi:uncharacterized protein involved in exopolysaccharide biosynthesis
MVLMLAMFCWVVLSGLIAYIWYLIEERIKDRDTDN